MYLARIVHITTTAPAVCAAILAASLSAACGNYTHTTRAARDEYYSGKCAEAAERLKKGADEEGKDQLLYLFDRATALHCAGQYEEAIKEFRRADKLADISDYTSLSKEAATLVTNDKIIQYKGEDFEKVLINQFLAMDYLMLGNLEDAQVENRRVNRKLYLMITEGKRKYKLNPMAKYLSALIYESEGHYNDAYIDYKAVYELAPDLPYLREDLWRGAWKSGMHEDMERWATTFGLTPADTKAIQAAAKRPEIVMLLEVGQAPEKVPHPNWRALPKFVPRNNPVVYADIEVEGLVPNRSHLLFDVEGTAIKDLDEKFAGLIAKRVGGVVVKEVIADKVGRQTDPILGQLLRFGMHAADQADLRSWQTLPQNFQVFRGRVDAGKAYKIKILPRDGGGATQGAETEKVVQVPGGASTKVFVPVRIY